MRKLFGLLLNFICWLLFSFPGLGQDDIPIGLIRGVLLEIKGTEHAGEIKVKSVEEVAFKQVTFTCLYDEKTYMENTGMRIFALSLHKEDAVEVVGDRTKLRGSCYARTIRVVDHPSQSQSRIRPYRMVTEHIAPRGDLTFSGVVIRLQNGLLILRTREGDASMLIREDTRFIYGGSSTDRSHLKANTRVFVRAGKNLEKETEAYQISWGEIFKP